jgi:hypothetical protein
LPTEDDSAIRARHWQKTFIEPNWKSRVPASSGQKQQEQHVQTYQIRITPRDARTADIYSSSHISDHAAVRRALALARDGAAIEVWRGFACVYSGDAEPARA